MGAKREPYPVIGQTLSHYRMTERLGAGGMGEVYRATDSRLGRDVALKVLPEAFASDEERMARFEREAHLLALLNHPNIATIHGLEEAEGVRFLVLELVEGKPLAERIARGPIPIDEALPIAGQIAEALEYAHEHGVIHRDLKPANVKVTPDGTTKILDFGLAKALAGNAAIELPEVSTVSDLTTHPGALLGTPAYMSPEQARGHPLDKRTDIWSFGCVLYEMLTGKRVFAAGTASDIIASILQREPNWDALPPGVPLSARRLMQRCLEKDPKRRLRDIGDARIEIEDTLTRAPESDGEAIAATGEPVSGWSLPLTWILLGLIVLFAALVAWNPWQSETSPRPSTRFSIILPERAPLAPAGAMPLGLDFPSLALSPDGGHLVYVALVNGRRHLHVRDMKNGEIEPIPGTEGGYIPFFSPDGEWVGFFADKKLKKVSISGGGLISLADAPIGRGGSWAADDYIYFVPTEGVGISKIPAAGGPVQRVTKPSSGTYMHLWPEGLPAGRSVLFRVWGWGGGVAIYSLESGEQRTIIEQAWAARYLPTGHLVYPQPGTLLAVPFDLADFKVTGPPVTVLEGLRTETNQQAQISVSRNGLLVYAPGTHASVGTLVWVDRKGNKQPLGLPPGIFGMFSLSPDGRTVAISMEDDIWLFDTERGTPTRFTFDKLSEGPVWTPDGKNVVFLSQSEGGPAVFWKPADGSRDMVQLTENKEVINTNSVSPDGKVLALSVRSPKTSTDIFLLPLESEEPSGASAAEPSLFLQTGFLELFPIFSPDGRWIAYTSDESGQWEVYVRPYPGPGASVRISTAGGEEPRWSRDGRELFYRGGSKWYVVDVTLGPEFRAGTPRVLFEGSYVNVPGWSYDVSPDGKRFLVIEGVEQKKALTELVVITNWFNELRRLAPPDRD
jgi:serine/threonine-protein kinase